ncbi:sigma 54 modulation/S30EA ribosomal C-terminal domain-containing protein [Pseudonocardia dioxanivorans]|jgi:hypothetical protein|uniref:sigma 54 modulation/S30EA ribosomal C-terminal domain-containing protein n=1 Tax=Pseudonocardia dioxanivorans TaxID=240495 RepID=UPI000CD05776|nr:sigma 54 modulation/S30EA ribosomal C-terminal domain-containing protein [Pseudonocardia dioxanivorans]
MDTNFGSPRIHVRVGPGLGTAREELSTAVAQQVGDLPAVTDEVRVRLGRVDRAGLRLPVVAQANLRVDGIPVRAQVAAATPAGAIDALGRRLGRQAGAALGPPAPRPWPDGRATPEPVPGPGGLRVVRCKTVALRVCSPVEAALTMDRLDHSSFLFVDAGSGDESVVRRVGPTGYRLTRLSTLAPVEPAAAGLVPLTVDVHPVPTRSVAQIVRRVDVAELDHRFFRDVATGRGAVLLRRYDGGLTLLRGAGPIAKS